MLAWVNTHVFRREEEKPPVREKPKMKLQTHRCTVEMLSEELDRHPSHDMLHDHTLDDSQDRLDLDIDEADDGLILEEIDEPHTLATATGDHHSDLLFSPRSDMSMVRAHSIDRTGPNDPHSSIAQWLDSLNTGPSSLFLPAFEV